MEVTFAMGIFMIMLGVVTQSLISSLLVLEEQRTNTLNGCKSLLAILCWKANSGIATDACPEGDPLFPCVALNWTLNWTQHVPDSVEKIQNNEMDQWVLFFSLPMQEYEIACSDADGNPARANALLGWDSTTRCSSL